MRFRQSRQNLRKRSRCQRTTVSGWTYSKGPRQADHKRRSDPKQPIERRQNGSPTFSLEGRELQPQGSILEGNGLVTAQQQSKESNKKQEQGWHICMLLHVSALRSDGIMASHRSLDAPGKQFRRRSVLSSFKITAGGLRLFR